jgi:hypothetical protein
MRTAKWRTLTARPIPPATSSEVMLALSCDSREAVDTMNEVAAENGGTADINPLKILVLCITETWRIPTATPGRPCGWIRQLFPQATRREKNAAIFADTQRLQAFKLLRRQTGLCSSPCG